MKKLILIFVITLAALSCKKQKPVTNTDTKLRTINAHLIVQNEMLEMYGLTIQYRDESGFYYSKTTWRTVGIDTVFNINTGKNLKYVHIASWSGTHITGSLEISKNGKPAKVIQAQNNQIKYTYGSNY